MQMRALRLGSAALGFALILLSSDASRYAHVRLGPLVPSIEIGNLPGNIPAMPALTRLAREAEVSNSNEAPRPAAAPESAGTATRPSIEPRQSAPHAARPLRGPSLPVRQFTPGSKGHAEAIASTIASDEYRNTIEPLARLYFAYFDRTADFEGLNYYIDERDGGLSLEAIANEFAGSLEFRQRYGTLDNAAFFDRVYRNIFDTVPDSAQRVYWIGQLDAGISRGTVMLAFSESGAFRAATTNEVFVTMAYAETLRQAPDPAGFAHWVRFLDAGNTREAVIAGLLAGARKTR